MLANHETATLHVTIELKGLARGKSCTVARVDDHHGNAYTKWVALGRPLLDPITPKQATLAALHGAAELREEPLTPVGVDGGGAQVTVRVPHHGVARVRCQV